MENTEKDNIIDASQEPVASPMKMWFKRLGVGAFLFFLGKGIVWLIILFGVGKCATN